MANILVFDECLVSRALIGQQLTTEGDWFVTNVDSVEHALRQLESAPFDAVISEASSPSGTNFELLIAVKERYPKLPVVMLTSDGQSKTVMRALELGASSYINKDAMSLRRLADTLDSVLSATKHTRDRQVLLKCMASSENQFTLDNNISMIRALQQRIFDSMKMFGVATDEDEMRVSLVLEEAFANAIYHGNLELSSELKEAEDGLFHALANERARSAPWCDRRVRLTERIDREQAVIIIEDEGRGFNVNRHKDCRDDENMGRASGRGMTLMRAFMDEVIYNERGNQVTLIKRRPSPVPVPASETAKSLDQVLKMAGCADGGMPVLSR